MCLVPVICFGDFFFHSLSLCHSAICLLGEAKTSFQWCKAVPSHFSPPSSKRPMT